MFENNMLPKSSLRKNWKSLRIPMPPSTLLLGYRA
jgi:hypothetical protein